MTSPRHCPLLDGPGPSRRLDVAPAPWEVRRCLQTDLVFLANPPSQSSYMEEYAWEVTHARESARRRHEEPVIYAVSRATKSLRHRWLKRDKLVGMVGRIARQRGGGSLRVVDIGCSDGGLFERLVASLPPAIAGRIRPVGIEISTGLAKRADARLRRHGGRCIHASGIDGLGQMPPQGVDVVILSCVLEHELEPLRLLAACRARLAVDGVVVVKVPNYASLTRWIRGRRWCGYRWPDHVNYFTPRTLAATAHAAGMRVERMGLRDRSPLSDSLYAVLGRDDSAAAASVPRLARAA